jgi:hypothetical protein
VRRLLLKQFPAKVLVSQTPPAPNRSPVAPGFLGAPFFHAQLELAPTRRRVLRNAHFTQEPVHPQPGRTPSRGLQVFGKATPPESAQWHLRRQQFGPHRVEMNIVAHRLEIAVAAAVYDERFVAATE